MYYIYISTHSYTYLYILRAYNYMIYYMISGAMALVIAAHSYLSRSQLHLRSAQVRA